MSGKSKSAESREGLFWPTLGLIVFLLVWLGLCTAGFWYLYVQVTRGFSDPESALTALQWMTWPFVVLAIAGPVVVILSIGGLRIIRDLLQMQKLIINLPMQLEPLIVASGGANFGTIAEQLRDKREFDAKSNENNRKTAEFVITAFELERASRRYRTYLTRDMVQELRTLRARIRNRPRIQPSANADPVQPNA